MHQSAAVTGDKAHAPDLGNLIRKIESGEDLKPHLSKRVATPYNKDDPAKPRQRREDLDLLLADWGIHHLHLSGRIGADGWAERGGDLLFSWFRPDDAYLIGIGDHNSWTEVTLLETIVREWPDAGLVMGSLSGLGLTATPTAEERRQLRNAGVASPVEIDGKVYMPRSQTTAGTAIDITRAVHELLRGLDRLGKDPKSWLRQQAAGRGGDFWRPAVHGDACGFTNGSTFIPVVDLS